MRKLRTRILVGGAVAVFAAATAFAVTSTSDATATTKAAAGEGRDLPGGRGRGRGQGGGAGRGRRPWRRRSRDLGARPTAHGPMISATHRRRGAWDPSHRAAWAGCPRMAADTGRSRAGR